MSQADELLRNVVEKYDGNSNDPYWSENFNRALRLARAYLSEKPHDEAARKLYVEHTANGVYPAWSELEESSKDQYRRTASPPHAAAEPELDWEDAQIATLKPVEIAFWSRQVVEPLVFNRMLERLRASPSAQPIDRAEFDRMWAEQQDAYGRLAEQYDALLAAQPIAREPTQLMIQAAIDEDLKRAKTHQPVTDYGGIWRAMYDAALKRAGKEST